MVGDSAPKPDTRIEMEVTVRYFGFEKTGQTHSLVYQADFDPGDTKRSVVRELFAQAANVHLDRAEDEGFLADE